MSTNAPSKKPRHFSFDVQTATDYGVDEAIMIQNFVFWIEKNLANGKNYHDGRTWTYNTQEAFTFLFPFWSHKQIRRIIDSLTKQDVIVTGNYNQHAYDRTQWYAFKDEGKWLNMPENMPLTLEDVDLPKWANGNAQTGKSICPNGQMEMPKQANGFAQMDKPIPDTTTNASTNLLPNNNSELEPSDNPVKSVNEILLLSLIGLNEKQKTEASKKLSNLSPDQRDLAIQIFNKTVLSGEVKTSPMALLNQLVNIGQKNALEPTKIVEPITVTQVPKTPVVTIEERENTRLEVIKALVMNKKPELLKEFSENGYVMNRVLGTIIEPDLRRAGLFD